MTLKEAIKILKKEGYCVEKIGRPCSPNTIFTEYESPEICEAMQVVCSAGYGISMLASCFNERKARLSLDLAENCNAPVSGKEQSKEGNPALKEAASQFNDALLDEQGKKIKRFGKEIARLNEIIHKKNLKIAEKDEVIVDLGKELKAQKDLVYHISKLRDSAKINLNLRMKECEKLKEELEEANNLVKEVRKGSKEYCEYGIAAEKMIQKLAKIIVSKGLVPSDVFEKCRLWANGYRFNPQLPELSKDDNSIFYHIAGVDVAEEGADHTGVMVLCGKDFAKILKEDEEAAEELSKVLNDVIDRFLLFGEIILLKKNKLCQ